MTLGTHLYSTVLYYLPKAEDKYAITRTPEGWVVLYANGVAATSYVVADPNHYMEPESFLPGQLKAGSWQTA
jgi:hypothetical protein